MMRIGFAAVAAVLCVAVGLIPGAGAQTPEPQPGFAESLCPRLQPPDEDCYTIALPAEVWSAAATMPIRDDRKAIEAYDSLIPEPFFPLPGRREVGVLMFRLESAMSPDRDIDTDPGPGYAEGTVAIRVGFPAEDGYPYREGWWVIAQPLNDESQYGAGRDIGLPKYLADAGLRIDQSGVWRAHATDWAFADEAAPGSKPVPGGNRLDIEWTADDPGVGEEREKELWTWGQYGEPLFVQKPPYDQQADAHEPALVKFTPVSVVPVSGAPESPVTAAPDPRIGSATVTLEGETPSGVDFAELLGRGPHEVAGTSAFTRGFAFITSDGLENNRAEDGGEPPPPPDEPPDQGGTPPGKTPGCAAPAPGGEWRVFGQNFLNHRAQPEEDEIDASNVGALEPHFVFDANEHGSGVIHSTPIVADGCVYFGTTTGWMFAINAETGERVWSTKLDVADSGLLCTGVIGSTPPVKRRVYGIVSQAGSPYLAALDQRTGRVLWKRTIDDTPLVYNCGSPVVFGGVVIAPFTGDQTGATNRGGYTLFDAKTGRQLAKRYTIPEEDFEAGYKGGGIWTTAAVDPETRYAYMGTANPDAGSPEHRHTDALLKVDIDRRRKTFGEIIDSYKGTPDRYVETGLAPFPCDPDPNLDPYIRSVLCGQMDLDFGTSPNLIEGPDGRLRVGALQKSGIYHLADAGTMDRVWATPVSPPVFYGNGGTAATDGDSLFTAGSPPGHMVSLGAAEGDHRWVAPFGDAIHYQEVSYANGLVYTNDAKGHLNVFRADNGLLVGHRWIGDDIGKPVYAEESSGSTAIARNTVYVAASSALVAYRPR